MWDQIIRIDTDDVICDLCNADYSQEDDQGGVLVGSYALCPECAAKHEGAVDDQARPGESFREFVLRIRR